MTEQMRSRNQNEKRTATVASEPTPQAESERQISGIPIVRSGYAKVLPNFKVLTARLRRHQLPLTDDVGEGARVRWCDLRERVLHYSPDIRQPSPVEWMQPLTRGSTRVRYVVSIKADNTCPQLTEVALGISIWRIRVHSSCSSPHQGCNKSCQKGGRRELPPNKIRLVHHVETRQRYSCSSIGGLRSDGGGAIETEIPYSSPPNTVHTPENDVEPEASAPKAPSFSSWNESTSVRWTTPQAHREGQQLYETASCSVLCLLPSEGLGRGTCEGMGQHRSGRKAQSKVSSTCPTELVFGNEQYVGHANPTNSTPRQEESSECGLALQLLKKRTVGKQKPRKTLHSSPFSTSSSVQDRVGTKVKHAARHFLCKAFLNRSLA